MIRRLLARGDRVRRAQLAVSAVGALGGAAIGNVPGAVLGQTIGVTAADFAARALSARERERFDAFMKEMKPLVEERLARGEHPRSDEHFASPRAVGARLAAP